MRRRDLFRLAKEGMCDEELDRLDDTIVKQLTEGIDITLTQAELDDAYDLGERRNHEAIAQGKKDAHGFKGSAEAGLECHKLGAAGELAASKALGMPWERRINNFELPDLGDNIDVKTRPSNPWKVDLQVRPKAKNHRIFVHVVRLSEFEFRVHGWLYGHEAKRVSPFTDHRPPVYYTPIIDLRPLQDLLVMIQAGETV